MLLERLLTPVATAFSPDLVLVSAGFDLHRQDPLGGMFVTAAGFAAMTRLVLEIADQCCSGRLVLSLEGGYDLQALRNSVKAVLREMAGLTQTDRQEMMMKADRQEPKSPGRKNRWHLSAKTSDGWPPNLNHARNGWIWSEIYPRQLILCKLMNIFPTPPHLTDVEGYTNNTVLDSNEFISFAIRCPLLILINGGGVSGNRTHFEVYNILIYQSIYLPFLAAG